MCMLRHAFPAALLVVAVVGVRVGDDADGNDVSSMMMAVKADERNLVLNWVLDENWRNEDMMLNSEVAHYHAEDDYHPAHEHGHDHDDVKTIPYACHSGLNNWEKEWSEQKKTYCCEAEHLGCKAEHFDCMEGLDKWEADWSELKISWCCHNKNIACIKCDDYACPPGHKKIAVAVVGSLKCKHSPCKNSECCEMWGNMELVRRPTPRPTPEPVTPFPTPMPTIPHLNDPYDCGAAIVDANTGWARSKKEWCCLNKNIGCKQMDEVDAGHGRVGWGSDGRRRTSFSDGRRRWSSAHDRHDDQECHDYYYYYMLFPDDELMQLSDDSETDADQAKATAKREGCRKAGSDSLTGTDAQLEDEDDDSQEPDDEAEDLISPLPASSDATAASGTPSSPSAP